MVSVYINSFGCRNSYWQTPSRGEVHAKKLVFAGFPRTGSPCNYDSGLICKNWQNQHTKSLLNLCKATAGLWSSNCTQRGGSCGWRLQGFMDKCGNEEHCRTFSKRWTSSCWQISTTSPFWEGNCYCQIMAEIAEIALELPSKWITASKRVCVCVCVFEHHKQVSRCVVWPSIFS